MSGPTTSPGGGRPGRRWAGCGERGSASVLAIGVVALVGVLLLAGLAVAAVAIRGQQVRTAADLAALAAAGHLAGGGGRSEACAVASQVARRNDAVVTWCSVSDRDAAVGQVAGPVVDLRATGEVAGTGWSVDALASAAGVVAEEIRPGG